MNIIMMGAQGTGKGTVAGFLKEGLGLPHISTGEIFRKNIQEQTKLGKLVAQYADEGKLVPDDLTNEMVKQRLNEPDCANGFILDGYPRNINQAQTLDNILAEKHSQIDLVVNLNTPQEEIIDRVMARRECPKCKRIYNMILKKPKEGEICDDCKVALTKRADDTEERLQIRLNTFFKETAPVIEFYRKKGIVRDEEISISINRFGEDVAKDIIKYFKEKE